MRRLLLLLLSGCSSGTNVQVETSPTFSYSDDHFAIGRAAQLRVPGSVVSFVCAPSEACGGTRWEENRIHFVPLTESFAMEARVRGSDGVVRTIDRDVNADVPDVTFPDVLSLQFVGAETSMCTHAEEIVFDAVQNDVRVPGYVDKNSGCTYFVPAVAGALEISARVAAYGTAFYRTGISVEALEDVATIELHGCANKTGVGGNTLRVSFRADAKNAQIATISGPLPASAGRIENAGDGVIVEQVSHPWSVESEYRLHGTPSTDAEIVVETGAQKARLHLSALPSCY